MKTTLLTLAALLTFTACGSAGKAGDSCTTDDDCEDGLVCHVEEHDDHGDEEEHEDEEGEEGVCEEEGEDDHDDHDDE
jgi:hypothetical protein